MNKLNKFLVFSLMLVTAFSMSFGGVVKVRAEGSFEAGTLIAQEGVEGAAVYYVGSDGKKYVYPDHFTYLTWYENWDGIERVSVSVLDEYENGGAITYRPGTKLVTTQDTAVVYALEAGGTLRSVVDEDTVVALYGADWGSLLTDVDTATFASFYSAGDPLDAMLPSGTLVSFEETDYYVDGNDLRPFADMDAFDANNFNSEFILVVDSIDSYGTGESITGAESALYEFTPVTGGSSDDSGDEASAGELSVSLASNTAVAATIISDTADSSQALIPFVSVNFTAPDTGDVTNVKFERTGISADTDINNSYLYDGVTRLAEGGSVSSGVVTFNDSTGLFVVSAGTTKTIDFKIDLLYNTSAGKTMEFGLSEVTTSNDATINGDLPLVGNTMTTASIADLGNVTITNGTTPASDTTVDPGETDYEIYKITLAANDQDMQLEYFKLTLIGSAAAADFENINLTKGGVVLATSSIDDNRELVFDLSSDPYVIEKGQAPSFSVRADIVSGSTRDFKFSTEYSSDLVLKDNNYDVYVTPFGSSAWTAKKAASGTEFSINSGSLAVSLDTSSPTENVASDATNVKLATFKFEATGEDVKVSNLDINAGTASGIEGGLNNGKILLDGIQVGTTKDLTEATDVNFTFGSSFIVPAGEFKLVDV